jgi:site-specific DNA-cytosine methylase
MRILIACEFSGIVRDAFRDAGHDATSCDLLPSERPGPHYQGDVRDLLGEPWDMMVAHPPCTHLCVSGARWFAEKRADGRQQEAIDFVLMLAAAPIPRIAIENPVGILSTAWRKPDCIVKPWQFGDEFNKTTCLWLKGLPPLLPVCTVWEGEWYYAPSGKRLPRWYALAPHKDRTAIRSRTFSGIAKAMALQWGTMTNMED